MTDEAAPSVAALWQAAVQYYQAGQRGAAEDQCRRLLSVQPDHVAALNLLGVLLAQAQRRAAALPLLRRAAALCPDDPAAWNNLAELCRQEGLLDEAQANVDRCLALAPYFPEAHFNRANVLKDRGLLDDAIAGYREAVRLRSDYAKAHFNLGNALRLSGRVPWAADAYRRAVALRPDWSEAFRNLGVAHLELGETEQALACFHRAQALHPAEEELETHLGDTYAKQGRHAEASAHYRAVLARHPERWLGRLRLEALTEVIPFSNSAIDESRTKLLEVVRHYQHCRLPLAPTELAGSGAEPPSLLAYQGRDDRPLMEAYGALFADAIPPLEPQRRTGKPHVGFLVTHGHEGVFARCLGGLVARLASERLRVSLVSSRAGVNVLRHLLPFYTHGYLALPDGLPEAAAGIRAAGIDVLHYWEVGTDSFNYFLPFFQPAPVQSATWGWPVTTGNPRVNYFVSCDLLEPSNAAAHYTERLVRLRSLPTYYARPPVSAAPPARDRWGLPAEAHVYLCMQNLRKCHPDFDPVLGDLLRRDPAGLVVLIGDEQPTVTELLQTRLRQTLADVADRVRVVARMAREDYLGLVTAADVVLDTLYYGGGANSVYDAVAAGTPVVTLPGPHHRGRWAAAVFQQLGLPELVVDTAFEYIHQAMRIAGDPDYRHELSEQLTERGSMLFEDRHAVAELETWCLQVAEAGPTLPG